MWGRKLNAPTDSDIRCKSWRVYFEYKNVVQALHRRVVDDGVSPERLNMSTIGNIEAMKKIVYQ